MFRETSSSATARTAACGVSDHPRNSVDPRHAALPAWKVATIRLTEGIATQPSSSVDESVGNAVTASPGRAQSILAPVFQSASMS